MRWGGCYGRGANADAWLGVVIMYNVGSSGTVDPGDIAKVVCTGSIIQLGEGPPQSPPPSPAGEIRIPQRETTATIRYGVDAEFNGKNLGYVMLVLRYRPGAGSVVAMLNEVPLWWGVPPDTDPGTVTETTVLEFHSGGETAPQVFTTNGEGGPGLTNASHVLNFTDNYYYVAVTLSASETVVGIPPALASVKFVPWQEW